LLIAMFAMVSWVNSVKTTSEEKEAAYTAYQTAVNGRRVVEKKLAARSGQMDYWDENLQKGFVQVMNERVTLIMERFKPMQLRLVEIAPGGVSAIAKNTEAQSSSIMLTFEGGFGPMQFLMGEIETVIPQLELESLDISVGKPTGRGTEKDLKFRVVYSAWSKQQ